MNMTSGKSRGPVYFLVAVSAIFLAYVVESFTFIGNNVFLGSIFEEVIKLLILAWGMLYIFRLRYASLSVGVGLTFLSIEVVLFVLGYGANTSVSLEHLLSLRLFYTGFLHVATCLLMGYGIKLYRDNKRMVAVIVSLIASSCLHLMFNLIGASLPVTNNLFTI